MKTFGTLFQGGGGADLGLSAAGLENALGVEYDPAIAAVAQVNGFSPIVDDVRRVDYAALPRVDWLHASPVCTRASNANPGATESEDDLSMADAVVRAIRAQQPQVFTLENVWFYRTFGSFERITAALGDLGYMWDFEHVNAADFGVPQTRKRLILRASRCLLPPLPPPVRWVGWYEAIEDLIPMLPESKLAPWQLARLPADIAEHVLVEMHNTARDATVRGASEPSSTISGSVADRPSHQLALLLKGDDNSGDFGVVRCAQSERRFTLRASRSTEHRALLFNGTNAGRDLTVLDVTDPSFTMTGEVGKGYPRAWAGARVVSMTPRALARFQSFPDWYKLPESRALAAKIIGNAVPPLLMQRIAEGMIAGGSLQA